MKLSPYGVIVSSESVHLAVCLSARLSVNFLGPNSTKLVPIDKGCPSVSPSVCSSVRLSVRPSCRHRFLVRAVTFKQKVVETWFWAQIKGIDP